MTGMNSGIVAGYDGSPGSGLALCWAAKEAKARGTTLTVCLAWTPDHMTLPTESALCDLARQHGKEILARGLPYAESVLGPGRVAAALVGGSAAQALCERSRTAEMVVVGSHGHSELPGLLLGSVSWQVAGHASGRVVVVRGEWQPPNQPPGPVVVGADGSPGSQAAIEFAFEEAVLHDVPLVAVCALADAAWQARRDAAYPRRLHSRDGLCGEGASWASAWYGKLWQARRGRRYSRRRVGPSWSSWAPAVAAALMA